MSRTETRLAELGLQLPQTAAPAGVYIPAMVNGSLVFTAGQLPLVSGELPRTGKVGDGAGMVTPADAKADAARAVLNALAAIKGVIANLDRITQIVKVTGFVASDPSFSGQPGVINGASELLGDLFGERGRHARSAVGVAVLPLNAPVEVELIVAFSPSVGDPLHEPGVPEIHSVAHPSPVDLA
jgi:enamine deaminase RidA (YjgF/YER057c/UK114 family)